VTIDLIRAYERAIGDDVDRRGLFRVAASAALTAAVPDVAIDVARSIAAERSRLLETVQTSHDVDRTIGALIARDQPSIAALSRWLRKGPPVLRVNSAGILAKLGSPNLDNHVITALRADTEARTLYLQAVASRVLAVPWNEAGRLVITGQSLPEYVDQLAAEVRNTYDAGARWCATVLLARTRPEAPAQVDEALRYALQSETSVENLRAIAGTLAGLDPTR
jgi:hypothetical protein